MKTLGNQIIVGMSGGVDSSVTALLLKQQGNVVCGTFMRNWEADASDPYCQADQDLTDAKAVCNLLGISLTTVNFANEYWDRVFQYFLNEYSAGRTPNPDILCNQEIKFRAFLDHALRHGADKIATGHYARIKELDGQYQLLKAVDLNKDQSYFLYRLNQHQLQHSLFPLGNMTKPAVRELAQTAQFPNHKKKDSTGICFIGERKFNTFLKEYLLAKPGDIYTDDGQLVGQHHGLMFYTIGQRQGIGIGGMKHARHAPWYVLAKNIKENQLIIGQGHEHPDLFSQSLIFSNASWVSEQSPTLPLKATAKIRYRQNDQACVVTQLDEQKFKVSFETPQRAITPGQSVVFYNEDVCLGGGIIQ